MRGRPGAPGCVAPWGFPVRTSGGVVGVLDFFAREVREPDDELIDLLAALGGQIGEFVEGLRAREALERSESRKTAVLESALDCVITIDHEGRVVEFNQAAERTFGRLERDIVGQELAELIVPPSLRERHRTALQRYLETEQATILGQRIELTGMRANGDEFPLEAAINRIQGQSPPMFTGYMRDISARKEADDQREELLRLEQLARVDATQARDQLAAILRGVADGVTAQAPDGTLLFANAAAVEVLGYASSEELLSAPLTQVMDRFEMFDAAGHPFPLERLPGRRALLGEEAEEVVRFRVRANGEERWSVVKATPIMDGDGRITMAINVFEDISEHKRAEQQQRFLSKSSGVLASSLDPDETLRQVASLAVPEIADWVAVDLASEDGSIERVALVHADPARLAKAKRLQERYPPDPSSPYGVPAVLRSGRSELHPDVSEELLAQGAVDEEHLELLREFGLRSALIVPMVVRDRVIGALSFVTGRSGRRFDAEDVVLAEELGRRCAIAIENSRLFGERAYIAKTLQESLLPAELPEIPGIQTAARFRAAGEGNDVGGDFYDIFETGGRGWTVLIGDVCGKGPDAAAVTALARYTLRAAAMRERLPSRSLELLNEALLRQRGDRRFCTVGYAYLESLEGGGARVGFASGGHPLPVLLRADGSVEWLGEHGTLLGVVPDPRLVDRAEVLAPGDALVFYTDGVIEAGGADLALGEAGLSEVVGACAGQDAEGIAACVEAAALEAQDGSPRDDIAVVVIRVDPASGANGAGAHG